MYFTSYGFLVFLTVIFILYYTVFRKYQWQALLAASVIFYALSGWMNLVYIVVTIITAYITGRLMAASHRAQAAYLCENAGTLGKDAVKEYKSARRAGRRRHMVLCLVINFGILAFIKYADFVINNINGAARALGGEALPFFSFVLPLGISFYTFQTMGYVIDVYRGKPCEDNIFKLALFAMFFPQMIQGPISRYDSLSQTLYAPKVFDGTVFGEGVQRVLWGFFKKLIIADRLLPAVRVLTGSLGEYNGAWAGFAMVLYAAALYADFTGGIDITIGTARALGITVAENFNMPFYSKNIAEYWRRWHITMGTWFKDCLFYPLSTSRIILKFMKWAKKTLGEKAGKRAPVYASTIILWFMTGLWHGASWNFIAWGLANGVVIILSQELTPLYARFHKRFNLKGKPAYNAFEILRTFLLMCAIRSFDIYDSVGTTLCAFASIFTKGIAAGASFASIGLETADWAVAAAGIAVVIAAGVLKRRMDAETFNKPLIRYVLCLAAGIAVIVFGAYGTGYDSNQFIYNQF